MNKMLEKRMRRPHSSISREKTGREKGKKTRKVVPKVQSAKDAE